MNITDTSSHTVPEEDSDGSTDEETKELHWDMKECDRCEQVKPRKNEDDPYCDDCMQAIVNL